MQLPYECSNAYEASLYPLWLLVSAIPGGDMLRLDNLYSLYELGRRLGALRLQMTPEHTLGQVAELCRDANTALSEVLGRSRSKKFPPLSAITESVETLHAAITQMMYGPNLKQNWGNALNPFFIGAIAQGIEHFQFALSEELRQVPVFWVDPPGNLGIEKLLKGAHNGYPEHVKQVLTDRCKSEIDEAGRCIVFERPTAVGFHVLRSVELAIKQYLGFIPGFTMPPLNRQNWGEYIKLLKDNGATRPVTDNLQNIKDNYRNPLMHPDDTLELPEAVSLFSVCQGMTESLVADLRKRGFIP